jgi:CelD/BcsL family acetyltransferase involved in cellulose biosynthesis
MTRRVDRIDTIERFGRLEPEWRALEERSPPLLPFHYFDWAAAWWTHLHESHWLLRDALDVRALRSPTGELLGIAPMMRSFRPGCGPLASRQLHYFGADGNLTEIRGLVAPASSIQPAYTLLLDDLLASADGWDWLVLSGVPPVPEIEAALSTRFARVERDRVLPNYVLTLRPTWDEFKGKLGRNIKESLRRCYNAPKRDGVTLEFETVSERRAVRAALGDFFHLHGLRARSDAAIAHPDVSASPAARRFILDVCERFADRNAFRLFRVRIGGAVVAVRLAFVVGDSLYLYYSGYDPRYAKYSVMTTVVAESIKYAIAHGFRTVNLSTGGDVSKTRWGPEEVTYSDWVVVSPSLRGRAVYGAIRAARAWFEAHARGRLAGLSSRIVRAHGGSPPEREAIVEAPAPRGPEGGDPSPELGSSTASDPAHDGGSR